jgi:outer membrane protein OmpA-like peptidoglycan-associated protein/Mg-chelatase subunit ChlD
MKIYIWQNQNLKYLKYILSLSASLLLLACPHQLVNLVEKNMKGGVYTPPYFINTTGRTHISVDEKMKFDSTNIPITLEIRNINSSGFPDSVKLTVIAMDSSGKFITCMADPYLKKERKYREFWSKLTDSCEGTKSTIENFTVREVREDNAGAYAVCYLLDFSGSMVPEGQQIIENTLPKMLKSAKNDDYISVIPFKRNAKVNVPLQKSSVFLGNKFKLNLDSLSEGTNIYKGLQLAFKEMKKSPDSCKKMIVLISDGQSYFSKENWDDVVKETRDQKISIFTLDLGLMGNGGSNMKKLADVSGGFHYPVLLKKEIPYIFADIYLKLKNYYEITYKAPDCLNRHKAEVTLNLDILKQGNKIANGYYDESVFIPIDPVGTVSFINIEFETGKSDINPQSFPLIDKVVKFMKDNKNVKIRISGHTDDIGSDEDNQRLSEERANAVMEYLMKKGIVQNRLETKGFGESKPLVPNTNNENRRRNRRTEFEIIEK